MKDLPKIQFYKKLYYAFLLIFNVNEFILIENDHNNRLPQRDRHSDPPRAKKLRTALINSFLIVTAAGIIGFLTSLVMNISNYKLTQTGKIILQFSSALVLLWGTLFLRGWEIQSYNGETLTERINQFIYRSLYFIGTVLIVLTLL